MSMIDLSPHAPSEAFDLVDGELAIGGRRVGDIVKQAGGTPLFVYSRAAIAAQVAAVRAALPRDAQLYYAVKANPMPELLRFMSEQVDGVDVASAGELEQALACGFAPERISFAGPGKTAAEIAACLGAGATLTAESCRQIELAGEALGALGNAPGAEGELPRIALRMNPALELRGAGMKMGGGPSPFGIDAEALDSAFGLAERFGLPVSGLHCHFGSQILNGATIAAAMQQCFEQMVPHLDRLSGPAWLNVGGGFGVPVAPGDRHLDLAPIADALGQILAGLRARRPEARLRIELGRYLVAEAGIYLMRVLERKQSRGKTFVICDGGLHHMQSATGTFGQVIRRNWPLRAAIQPPPPVDPGASVDVVGPLCTPLDCVGRDIADQGFEEGALVCLMRAGAYGRSASPGAFLGHPAAPEVLV